MQTGQQWAQAVMAALDAKDWDEHERLFRFPANLPARLRGGLHEMERLCAQRTRVRDLDRRGQRPDLERLVAPLDGGKVTGPALELVPTSRRGVVHVGRDGASRDRAGSEEFIDRRDDRGFQVGDTLLLREWAPSLVLDPSEGEYTGRELVRRVTYVMAGARMGVESGYVVMSLAAPDAPKRPRRPLS